VSEEPKKPNSAKGQESFDITVGNSLVSFFNRNATNYPTEVGAPKFDLVPVTKQKDIMLNVARLHASQEYDRIMELVNVLQRQAQQIQYRLKLTDMVHGAKYSFQLYHNQCYWLAFDHRKNYTILTPLGPNDWSTGVPKDYEYITRVKWLGDYTWIEVNPDGSEGTQTL